jgi:hypothetical protein
VDYLRRPKYSIGAEIFYLVGEGDDTDSQATVKGISGGPRIVYKVQDYGGMSRSKHCDFSGLQFLLSLPYSFFFFLPVFILECLFACFVLFVCLFFVFFFVFLLL